MSKALVLLVSAGLLAQTCMAAQMRSRAESVPGMQASNTVGLGDIWLTGGLSSYFRIRPVANDVLAKQVDTVYRDDFRLLYGSGNRLQRELVMVPEVGGIIGLANFLHLEVSGVPWDGEKLGAATARLQLTMPGNDNLRVFGFGVALNATLSTEEDIYSRGETTPGFDPLLFFTVMADLDWIKVMPTLPLKCYFNYSNLDDYTLAHAYTQHRIAFAAEYKGNRKGYWARVSTLLYRPLATRFNPDPSKSFLAPFYEMGVGYRTMLGNRISFTAEASLDPLHPISFYDRAASKPPRIAIGFQSPLVYNETRAEAIRALIFNDEERKRLRLAAAKNPGPRATAKDSAAGPAGLKLDEISLEERKAVTPSKDDMQGVLDDDQDKAVEKRKQIRGELKQIEDLLQ
ncbi:MAG: hypothetical protein JF616_20485 [Fibrobacteres bacterium]|jgi:hypothetical protein|nr:hypothetical protein [Fibrobacterota bacterium]